MVRLSVVGVMLLSGLGAPRIEEEPLVAGRDVEPPKRVYAPAPGYPEILLQARVQGLVVLKLTVSAEGLPTDIEILRSIPLADEAALRAAKAWRYEPSVVDGVPRRVEVVQAVGFFLDDDGKARGYSGLAADRGQPSGLRASAILELQQLSLAKLSPKTRKTVAETLQRLLKDREPAIASAAESALEKLSVEAR